MTYSVTASGQVIRDSDGLQLGIDPGNTDYAAYLDWLAAGNTATIVPPALLTVAEQIAKISAACQASIFAGFASSALGSTYWYPSTLMDQLNLNSSILASTLPSALADPNWKTPFWCAVGDTNGRWTLIMHTAAQIQRVGEDGKLAIVAAIVKNQQLAEQIQNADSDAAIAAINW